MMALAFRAAIRIGEAIGWPASTIAAFLKGVEAKRVALGPESLVMVDEASMLDLPTKYRIMRSLPDGCRLPLVGDPGQLPPIQFGLVLHALVERAEIPSVVLTRIYRQTEAPAFPRSPARSAPAACRACWTRSTTHQQRGRPGPVGRGHRVDVVADLGGFTEDLRIACAVNARPAGTEALNARFHHLRGRQASASDQALGRG